MSEEHQINLFARYEQRLLSGGCSRTSVIPAVVVTGFLGSGKTTLVQHILRNRGSLRIAVLVNEVGQLDVDSELINAKQTSAALGMPAADLSGGCVCCSRAEDLAAALTAVRHPRNPAAGGAGGGGEGGGGGAPCDYLLVETSGAADAGPLAGAITAAGFRLDGVVAVMDAEAGRAVMEHPVARAQVSCADVVVLNKCDLLGASGGGPEGGGGLGALADLEDWLEGVAPGVRVVRARFGEVPLPVVLDVEPVTGPSPPSTAGAAAGGQNPDSSGGGGGDGGGDGGVGFMSHESVPSAPPGGGGGYRVASGPLTADGLAVGSSRHTARRTAPPSTTTTTSTSSTGGGGGGAGGVASPHPHHHHDDHHHHHHHDSTAAAASGVPSAPGHHAWLHSGLHTLSLTHSTGPGCLTAFASFVTQQLLTEPALLRAKGVLWFLQSRSHRFVLQLSGRRRVEVVRQGPWEGPPGSSLVLIGTQREALHRLAGAFRRQVLGLQEGGDVKEGEGKVPAPVMAGGAATSTEASDSGGARGAGLLAAGLAAQQQQQQEGGFVGVRGEDSELEEVFGQVVRVITDDERLQLLERAVGAEAVSAGAVAAACASAGAGRGPADDGCSMSRGCRGQVSRGSGGVLLHFTCRGSALHGINGEELNGQLMAAGNASGKMLLVGVAERGRISAVSHVQARDRIVSLLLPLSTDDPERVAEQVAALRAAVGPVLRRAYAHVHNCKCDVGGAAQALLKG